MLKAFSSSQTKQIKTNQIYFNLFSPFMTCLVSTVLIPKSFENSKVEVVNFR